MVQKRTRIFFNNGLIDELFLTIEPISFGEGLPLHNASQGERTASLVSVEKINAQGTVVLHYVYANAS
ncbi:hypothetical protein COV04_04350 [Candidatus Uhrbacteria bacterium CG10_big_fil_rev_8_21_14_0_10_48_11]|uniref:Bacterial bifunctional deaminase-reductase C-terminal domain-containing protein n=1 Tax=Candidatus Uhrbacteria bacterium CG10_big_fil_rev_8_21_14_0_10_48_11 TaxID=1975037 RepID=A0A2M8LDQ6_9BACT|nr:MAG: hypothetical protein COV04_04350 [Candidatus Uhrbacteria bacterium CG10_big_fil_rev_8_21_14_0_10_48_11]